MMSGRFAQLMESLAILCIIIGIVTLCQSASFSLYSGGFRFLVAGWLGITIWSHRSAVRPKQAEGNPQITVNGHAPVEVVMGETLTT